MGYVHNMDICSKDLIHNPTDAVINEICRGCTSKYSYMESSSMIIKVRTPTHRPIVARYTNALYRNDKALPVSKFKLL